MSATLIRRAKALERRLRLGNADFDCICIPQKTILFLDGAQPPAGYTPPSCETCGGKCVPTQLVEEIVDPPGGAD